MKNALTYDQEQVFQHFGRSENFKLYTIADGAVTASEVVNTNGVGHEPLAQWLKDRDVDTVICGNIGPGARQALMSAGIRFFNGVQGNVDQAVQEFLVGTLVTNPDAGCQGHHHGEGHGHGHGGEGCGHHH